MPVTITKVAAKPKTLPPQIEPMTAEMSEEQLADAYGSLKDRADAILSDPVFVQLEEVTKALKAKLAAYSPEDELVVKGEHWIVEAGACSHAPRKIIDTPAVAKMLGQATFMKLAKVGVGDAEKYLTPEQVALVASEPKYTENRKLSTKFLG